MHAFIRYLLISLALFLLLNWLLPDWFAIRYPRELGPKFSSDIRMSYQAEINREKPEIILLGNSVVNFGIDPQLFEQLIQRKTLKFSFPGTASAYWYLLIKSNIVSSNPPPKYLLIFFTDNLLTSPSLGVNGEVYQSLIDEVAGEGETVLLQKAYLSQTSRLENYLNSQLPIFGERDALKKKIDNRLKYTLPFLVEKCDKTCLDAGLDETFSQLNMLPDDFGPIEQNAGFRKDSEWDFEGQVENSFLPDMIQLAQKNGIQLVFVRGKNARMMNLADETEAMRLYFQQMAEYFSRQDVIYLDFSHTPQLTLDMFLDRIHLNPSGQKVFTRLVAEALSALIR